MLTLAEIERMASDLIGLYGQMELDLIANIASRFVAISDPDDALTALQDKLVQMEQLRRENIEIIRRVSGQTDKEIQRIITDAGYRALDLDEQIYKSAYDAGAIAAAPLPASASTSLKRIIEGALDNTRSYFNLINTTAIESAQHSFLRIINQSYLETSTGITDYNSAVRKAVREFADNGITGAKYISTAGRETHNHIDVAVRRCIVTSTAQTAGQMQIARAKEWGSNLVEVSSHSGARPSHAVWQGKVYSLEGGTAKYPNLAQTTGYGTVTGLCGANCGHHFYPYFEGVSERTYRPYDAENNKQIYDQSQEQRTLERLIRQQKRRIAAGTASGEGLLVSMSKEKLSAAEAQLKELLRKTGRTRRGEREKVLNFDYK